MIEQQPDKDILDYIAAQTGDAALTQQIQQAEVSRRDYTRTGLFVYFEPNAGAAAVAQGVRPVSARLDAPELMDGAGCDLFLRDGRLHYLEVYARGGFLPENLQDYRLGPDN
ncbi:MAG: hypothetical protein HKN56_04285 [Gammaproteobacteria bacterium]|nr:hypothetical protein [Gammaproteobacteria bacterium]NND54172.1 hypothetical protein [Gammaproteobacteria bacterium]